MIVNGKAITRAERVCWAPGDDRRAMNARLLGPARIELDDGTERFGFVVASTDQRTLGQRFVAFYDVVETRDGRKATLVLFELLGDTVELRGVA